MPPNFSERNHISVENTTVEDGFQDGSFEAIQMMGVNIHVIDQEELLGFIRETISGLRKRSIMYVNAHAMNLSYKYPTFRERLNQGDLVFCDGFGVKWGARILGKRLPQRMTPPDWFPNLCEMSVENRYRLFLLGARPGVVDRAAHHLHRTYPALQVAGTFHGYFDKSPSSQENAQVLDRINSQHPDILVVGMGMPIQEYWISENWSQIRSNIVLTVGALFDLLSGEIPRAPRWATDRGFEWLGRLFVEPDRLGGRYIIGNPLFISRILMERFGILHIE
jgi:N-acetylglucosaminyldiphosphoundecaprenol N-acetyl-beta-D-mannosaminyltransferase